MTATASNVHALSNSAVAKQAVFTEVGELGKAEGAGVNSRPELAVKVVGWVQQGTIDQSDVGPIWTEFLAQKQAAKGANRERGETGDAQKSHKQQVSKLNQFVIAASLPNVDFLDVITRAKSYIDQTPELKGSTFDNMLTVARTQKDKDYRDNPLTDEQIKECLTPEVGEEKGELDYLKSVNSAMDKIFNGTEERPAFPSQELEEAWSLVKRRIAVLELAKAEIETAKKRAALVASNPSPIINRTVTEQGNTEGSGEDTAA